MRPTEAAKVRRVRFWGALTLVISASLCWVPVAMLACVYTRVCLPPLHGPPELASCWLVLYPLPSLYFCYAFIVLAQNVASPPVRYVPLAVNVVQFPPPTGNRCYNLGRAIKNFKAGVSGKDEIDVTPKKEEVSEGKGQP